MVARLWSAHLNSSHLTSHKVSLKISYNFVIRLVRNGYSLWRFVCCIKKSGLTDRNGARPNVQSLFPQHGLCIDLHPQKLKLRILLKFGIGEKVARLSFTPLEYQPWGSTHAQNLTPQLQKTPFCYYCFHICVKLVIQSYYMDSDFNPHSRKDIFLKIPNTALQVFS